VISHGLGKFVRRTLLIGLALALTACPLSDNYVIDSSSTAVGGGGTGAGGGGTGGAPMGTGGGTGGAPMGTGGTRPMMMDAMMPKPMMDAGPKPMMDAAGPAPMELGRGKSAIASSEQTSKGNLAPLGNDGDSSTRWSAADAMTPKWWRVDLGAPHRISRVEIDWEFPRVYGYTIDVSSNDTVYTTVVDRSTNSDPTQNQGADVDANGRYVRVTITSVVSLPITWASFYEVRVFGP
jgi:hypothetical protein